MAKNKKAVIGETFSWFAAFLIIFFIMMVFLSASIVFSASKKVVSGTDNIQLNKNSADLKNQEILLDFLDKSIVFYDGKSKIKELLIREFSSDSEQKKKIKEKIKEELDKLSKEYYGEKACYLLNLDLEGDSFDVCSFSCNEDIRFEEYVNRYKGDLLAKSIDLNLFSEKGKIKIKFYLGEC
jgi:hypothetical protein